MRQKFPDYDNCIVNLANSILNEFTLPEGGKALRDLLHIWQRIMRILW